MPVAPDTSRWHRLGQIFTPRVIGDWCRTHTAVPTVFDLDDGRWRVFYAARDHAGRSHVSWFDVVAGNPTELIRFHDAPILSPGRLGAFDDCGVMPSCVVRFGDQLRLYFIGWAKRTTVPYHNGIGLAVSDDGGNTWRRAFEGPLFGPTPTESYFDSTPFVMRDGEGWRCWYLSCTGWRSVAGRPEPTYDIKVAESADGVHWRRDGVTAIRAADLGSDAVCRPWVVQVEDEARMWFCFRRIEDYRDGSGAYQIGTARSRDRIRWTIDDEVLRRPATGWDKDMQAYPCVAHHDGELFLFYNGNGFGASGIGCLQLPVEDNNA